MGILKRFKLLLKFFMVEDSIQDIIVTFTALKKDIPSYVNIRGWKAYIKYNNQPQTCRVCEETDHIAKDCPVNFRRKPQENQSKDAEMPHEPEPNPTPEEITNTPSMQQAEPHVFSNVSLQNAEDCPTSLAAEGDP